MRFVLQSLRQDSVDVTNLFSAAYIRIPAGLMEATAYVLSDTPGLGKSEVTFVLSAEEASLIDTIIQGAGRRYIGRLGSEVLADREGRTDEEE